MGEFDRIPTASHPEGWTPLPQEYQGHDMVRYFTLMYMNETAGSLLAKSRNFNCSLYNQLQPYFKEEKKVTKILQKKKKYFFENTSVFMEYKRLREKWHQNLEQKGMSYQDTLDEFNEQMSGEEFFDKAQSIVSTWWDLQS